MFQNRSIEFQAGVRTVGVFVLLAVSIAAGVVVAEVFGWQAILVALLVYLVWQLLGMVYHSYCITLRQEQRAKKSVDQ